MDRDIVIRKATPRDNVDIIRLCQAQYERTPWEDGFLAAQVFSVYRHGDRTTGCLAFRRDENILTVIHVWVEDGFAGQRAGVALMKDMEARADRDGWVLCFDIARSNIGLMRAVEEHDCVRETTELPNAIYYRRAARAFA